MKKVTGSEAGLSQDNLIRLALKASVKNRGCATIQQIYDEINSFIKNKGYELSDQGKNTLRKLVNFNAVKAGFFYPHDKDQPGWRITPEGKVFINEPHEENETIFNVDTGTEEFQPSNIIKGTAFEKYCLILLKAIYPHYSWFYQGKYKKTERGLDLIGEKLGEVRDEYKNIGVQVKYHKENNAPTNEEWLKFLAGCFTRGIQKAIFVTTGRLTGEQRREAGEANVTIIEGMDEINRLAKLHNVEKFVLKE